MLLKENIKELKGYLPGKPIEELQRQLGLKKIYKLASNEIPFVPFYIEKAIKKELKKVNRYPEGDCFYLRQALSKYLGVNPQQIVFGNGSDELIVLALRAFTDKDSNIIVGHPTFLIYELQAKISDIKVKKIEFKGFRYDLEGIKNAIDSNTQIIFIANPDNPHGTYLKHTEVEKFLKDIPSSIIVFFDEAYFEFAPKEDFPHSLSLLKERGNIIITRTFSKAYGLAGLRIGYGITTKEIAEILNKVREPFNVNRLAQVAALEALKNNGFLKKVCTHNKKEKEFLYSGLRDLGLEYIPSVTNFILVNFSQGVKPLCEYLFRKGIIIRDMSIWGLNNFFRVTVGLREENRAFIKYLKEYMKRRRG